MMEVVTKWMEIHHCFLENIQNDIIAVALSLIGITISIFTLLFSFISSKRQTAIEMKNRINNGEKDPIFISSYRFCLRYIEKLGYLAKVCARILCLSIILFIYSWINHRIILNETIFGVSCLLNLLILVIISSYAIFVTYRVYKQFEKEIRI